MGPEEAVSLAIEVAEEGLRAGEMPIGALVLAGDEIVSRAFTQEQMLGRKVVHADLMAMLEADKKIGLSRSARPVTLVVNLEPCLMCMGAAITLGVQRVWFGLESSNHGAVALLKQLNPPVEQAYFRQPAEIVGGLHRAKIRDQFGRYAESSEPSGMADWARGLSLP